MLRMAPMSCSCLFISTQYKITHISQFKGSGLRTQKLATLVWRKIKALFVLALRPSISYPNLTFRTTDPRSQPEVSTFFSPEI